MIYVEFLAQTEVDIKYLFFGVTADQSIFVGAKSLAIHFSICFVHFDVNLW